MTENKGETEKPGTQERQAVEERLARAAVGSKGSVRLASGRTLSYRTTCEFVPVRKRALGAERGAPEAAIFTIAYQAERREDEPQRPLCFAFNGGPGSCSVWLHLGALGPRRVVVPDDGATPTAPYAVTDNPLTWLAHFDLVFIDPAHTGWSIAAGEDARKSLLSVDGDIAAFVEVIRTWLTRHGRWGSKLYLAGESYGTTRGAGIAKSLLDAGIAPSGVILVSLAMDLQSIGFRPRNELPYATFLPALANTAQYHGCLKGPLAASSEAARTAAEEFVQEEYVAALHAGARLGGDARARIARRVSELTGLPHSLVEACNLRIDDQTFFFEALRDRGLQVGRLDSRCTSPLGARRGRSFDFDPGIESTNAAYSMAANAYFRDTLGLDLEDRYEFMNFEVLKSWNFNRGEARGNAFCSTGDDLAQALRRRPHLRVFAASGRYDLGTPYSASDWSLAQMDAPADVLARVTHHYYDAGHMMYTRQADLEKLERDLSGWLAAP